jgi:hypothetical protein
MAKKSVRGRIVTVQEGRFRIKDAGGRSYILTLSHDSEAGIEDLPACRLQDTEVQVWFDGLPNLESGTVSRVVPVR